VVDFLKKKNPKNLETENGKKIVGLEIGRWRGSSRRKSLAKRFL
jgi:hypothetical protein